MTFVQEFLNMEKQADWKLMPGTKGNTGQTGSLGTGTFTPGAPATLMCKPSGPYYDAGFYRHMPFVPQADHVVCYHAEYMADAANLPKVHEFEMDCGLWTGTHRHHVAAQFRTTLHYYDPGASPKWVDTKLPLVPVAGQFLAVEVWCHLDVKNAKTTYLGIKAGGLWIPLTQTVIADAGTSASSFLSPILQLDSDKLGETFSVQVQNAHLIVR